VIVLEQISTPSVPAPGFGSPWRAPPPRRSSFSRRGRLSTQAAMAAGTASTGTRQHVFDARDFGIDPAAAGVPVFNPCG
jgi:hypothetical protein